MKYKAQMMLGWLDQVTYENGSVPQVNDATVGVAPTSIKLFEYAKNLNLTTHNIVTF